MKKNIYLILIFLHYFNSFSQNSAVDSLKQLLKNAPHDTIRCVILTQLIESENDDNIWPIYNKQLQYITLKQIPHSTGRSKYLFQYYYGFSLNNLGFFYTQRGETTKAQDLYDQSLKVQTEIDDKQGIAATLINIGYLLRRAGNVNKAIDYYHQALKLQLDINDIYGAANSYNNIGFIFDNQNEYEKALEYYNKSLTLYENIKSESGIANSYVNIAYIYKAFGDPDCKGTKKECSEAGQVKAIDYLNRAILLLEKQDDKTGLSGSLNLLGGIYDYFGDPYCDAKLNCATLSADKALSYYNRALELRLEIQNLSGICQSYNSLAEFMLRHNKLNQALDYGLKSLDNSKQLESPERIMEAAYILKNIYQKQKQFEKSLLMYQLYIQMRDSIYNEETKSSAIKKGFQIDYEKKATADSVKVSEEKKVINAQLKQERTQRFALYGGILLVGLFGAFMYNRFKITHKQNLLIHRQKIELQKQKEVVEEHQKETLDSIHYAKRIQTALITNSEFISKHLPDNFIFFHPKDIVSGDFYWATKNQNRFYLAVCDSTGHGVPGAFMSLLNMGFLSEAIKEKNIEKPNEIFNYVRERLISTISDGGQQDGMDGILICFDSSTNQISYAAANNEPILISDDQIIELPKDKMPVGRGEKVVSFNLYTVDLKPGDTLYLYSDGYADQFGGPKGKKFKYKALNELLLHLNKHSMAEQRTSLELRFNEWKGSQEQVDDVLIIGIKA